MLFHEDQLWDQLYESGLDSTEKLDRPAEAEEIANDYRDCLMWLAERHDINDDPLEMMGLFDHQDYGEIMQEHWEEIDDKNDLLMALAVATERTLSYAVMHEAADLIRTKRGF